MNNFLEKFVVEKTFVDFTKQLVPTRNTLPDWGRDDLRQVVNNDVFMEYLHTVYPDTSRAILIEAKDALIQDRSSKSLYEANKEVYALLKNGYQTEWIDENWEKKLYHIHYIDWKNPWNNLYHYKQQFYVRGKIYDKEPDIVYFVNGIPLVVVECKNSSQPISKAFDDNIADYIEAIPQLFVYNQFIILTNGVKTKLGAFTSSYEHYFAWKKVATEKEKADGSMETAIKGILDPVRLLDITENFIVFDDHYHAKIVAKNHQYLWVGNVYERFLSRKTIDGKLGVFRHTQWSGKSYSMMFVVQKILRNVAGNFTFVIVTDRTELDNQIAKWFAHCGIVNDVDARAESIADLKKLLQQDRRVIFTLIHKFDETLEKINERDDIIVITDEAHRSQYGDLAMWMRQALPNAMFLWFTGTPLISEDAEPTKKVFGEYVSVYNFSQSIDDGATVPIYYENFTPKVINENPDLAKELEALQTKFTNSEDDEVIDHKLSLAYAILTRDDILDEIAQHIATHFLARWQWSDGKAMVVCINKKTAVKMYWKVTKAFEALHQQVPDMGVMISLWDKQAEDRMMEDTGGDFSVLRKQIQEKDGDGTPILEKRFKNPEDSLQIVFVCSMWLTGFDAKNCTTLYLQKPMAGHTLMQTIARTNRVYKEKSHGLVVDYVNVFSNLQKALRLYASPELGEPNEVIKHKTTFVDEIEKSLVSMREYLKTKHIDLEQLFDEWEDAGVQILWAVESIIESENSYKEFFRLHKIAQKNYQALLPDPKCAPYTKIMKMLQFLVDTVKQSLGDDSVSKQAIYEELEALLDRSIKVDTYKVVQNFRVKDLSKIDYSKLKEEFGENQKNTIIQQLAKAMKETTEKMIGINPQRKTLMDKLEKIMEAYNKGSKEIEQIFEELVKLSQDITDEEQRAVKQEMSEEQLAVFDLLYKDELTDEDKKAIKQIAKELLDIVKAIISSSVKRREKEQTQAELKVTITNYLYDNLPLTYDEQVVQKKTQELYLYMYEHMRV